MCTSCLFGYRSHHCLKTLILLLKFVSRETKESFVTKTNALLESTLISVSDVSVSIATVLPAAQVKGQKILSVNVKNDEVTSDRREGKS